METKNLAQLTLFVLSLSLVACTHTLSFRAAHFATPVVSEKQWGGHAALTGTSVTNVTIIDNVAANPPSRNEVSINKDIKAGDISMINRLGIDLALSPLKSLEVYWQDSYGGLRWQFLNHSEANDAFVAALHGGLASRSSTQKISISGGEATSSSDISSSQGGVSLGYKYKDFVPYLAYIYEKHQTSTQVENPSGSFGAYDDSGTHQYFALGVSTHKAGAQLGLEYNRVKISWDRSKVAWQDSAGVKLGYAW